MAIVEHFRGTRDVFRCVMWEVPVLAKPVGASNKSMDFGQVMNAT